MIRFSSLLLTAIFPFAVFAEDKKDEKKPVSFNSKDGKFAVTLPEKPSEKTNQVDTEAGKITIHMFAVDQKDRAYIVTYNDYPAAALDADAEKVLAGVIDGNAKSIKGKVTSNNAVTIGKKKSPGREVVIEFGDKQLYRARVYLVGERLYQVVALGPTDFAKSKAVDEYLKSFALAE